MQIIEHTWIQTPTNDSRERERDLESKFFFFFLVGLLILERERKIFTELLVLYAGFRHDGENGFL